MKARVTLTIEQTVLDEVDEAAWRDRLSRSAWVEQHLRFGVNQQRIREDGLAGRGVEVPGSQVSPAGALSPRPASSSGPVLIPVDPLADEMSRAVNPFRNAEQRSSEVTPDWRGGKP